MKNKFRAVFFFFLFTGISLQGFALDKNGKPGSGDGLGNTGNGNEVKLPIGLPFQLTDPSRGGTANEDSGVPVDQPTKIVYTFDLPDGQGPQSVHETHSAFAQARSMNAACVLIRMNSMSSALNAAENLSTEIVDYDRPVMVYVNDRAFSAEALISMAAENKKGISTKKSLKQNQKNQKNNSSRASNNSNHYSQNATDENSCVSNLSNSQFNKNVFFTIEQNGDLDDVLVQAGLNNYTVVHYSPGFFAQLLDLCMKPYMSLILILLLAMGMRTQLKSAFPGPATFLLLVTLPLFAIPLFVGGLAGAGEFGLVILFGIAFIISLRKKSSSVFFQIATGLLLLIAFSLCQSENLGLHSNWKIFAFTFLFTSFAFIAGWFIPSFFRKSTRTRSVAIPSVA